MAGVKGSQLQLLWPVADSQVAVVSRRQLSLRPPRGKTPECALPPPPPMHIVPDCKPDLCSIIYYFFFKQLGKQFRRLVKTFCHLCCFFVCQRHMAMNQFIMAFSVLNSGSVLSKTGRFSRNWPLECAKFASVFLMNFNFCIRRLTAASKSRLCAKNLL
jgi:hypothetical protein